MDDIPPRRDQRQIQAQITESYEIIPGSIDAGLIILCDHATNTLPSAYGTLGLGPEQLQRHIAYDIGVEGVGRTLAQQLGAPAILTRFSRLLIDPNRGEDDPTLVMRISDGAIVPANRSISDTERSARLNSYYRPYHRAIDGLIDQCIAAGTSPTLLSIHSFTEVWRGESRKWHAGILWDQDDRFSSPLLQSLMRPGDLIVGDNEPYSGRMQGDCMWQHGTQRDLPHAIVEIRQDLIGDANGQKTWANRLANVLRDMSETEDQLNFLFANPQAA